MQVEIPLRSHLYAPGNNSTLLDKVWAAGADAVILDLEDAVPPGEKERARKLVAAALEQHTDILFPTAYVRINDPSGPWAEADVRTVVRRGLTGIRIPKVEDAKTIHRVAGWVDAAESAAGLPAMRVRLLPILESAVGVWRAFEVAAAHPRVVGLSYGAADLRRDLRLGTTPDELELVYVRSHLVLASRAAGIAAPIDTVFSRLDDTEGLEASARRARTLGFFGKGAIHPRQIPIINAVFTPTQEEVKHARKVVEAAAIAAAQGTGALRLSTGEFVDTAIVRQAQGVLELGQRLGMLSDSESGDAGT